MFKVFQFQNAWVVIFIFCECTTYLFFGTNNRCHCIQIKNVPEYEGMDYSMFNDDFKVGWASSGWDYVGPAADYNRQHLYFFECGLDHAKISVLLSAISLQFCCPWIGRWSIHACRVWRLVRYNYRTKEKVTVYQAPRQLFPAPHAAAAYGFSHSIAFDPDAQIVYWVAQVEKLMFVVSVSFSMNVET